MAANTLKLAFILSATDKMSRIIDEAVKKSTDKLSAFERTTSKIGRSMTKAGTVMLGASAAVGGSILAVGNRQPITPVICTIWPGEPGSV